MPRFTLDLDRPKFHTLVFGFNLVGLARVGLAKSGDHRPATLIIIYLAIIPIAVLLGRLAADRMKDRTPRIYTSVMSLCALTLNLIPDASSMIMTPAMSDLIAVVTALIVMSGTAIAEMLHRLLGDRPPGSAPGQVAGPGRRGGRSTDRTGQRSAGPAIDTRPQPWPQANAAQLDTRQPPRNCQCPPDPGMEAPGG
jgi:hypothetical protein